MEIKNKTFQLTDKGNFGKIALVTGISGIILSIIGSLSNPSQFYYSYLTAFAFWVTICLGGLFFTMLHHLVNATWSIVLRRIAETIMFMLPVMAVLFIPVLFGMNDLYEWSDKAVVETDHLLQEKEPYLNKVFFIARTYFIYFGIWGFLAWKLYKTSLDQDRGFQARQLKAMRRVSAPGMIIFALTISFASFDWLMSLDARWYSTVFGVYIFSGSTLSVMAFLALMSMFLRRNGVLRETITIEHYHDLGRLMLTFTIFWAYIAFSQYFLIWYGNIPEETEWFLHRWGGAWKPVSLFIAFGFIVPFLTMMFRSSKRSFVVLTIISVYLLFFHWMDMYWLIAPNLHLDGADFSWMDLTTMLGVGGLLLSAFWRQFTSNALVPVNDPRLEASVQFKI